VVERYGVDAIVLNDRFAEPPHLDYWAPRHPWFVAARARLDAHPEAFPALHDRGDFVVYGVRRAALAGLSGSVRARPFVEAWDAGSPGAARPAAADRGPALLGLTLSPGVVAAGGRVVGVARWRAVTPAVAGSWLVAVRFDRDLPAGWAPPAFVGKPVRKLLERLRHERYRFRADHLPAGGEYGVDLWKAGEVVRDSFALEVPADAAEGTYRVEVLLLREPHYANLRLSDWFLEQDFYSGVPAGRLVVGRGVGARQAAGEGPGSARRRGAP
jgi:hypothetical protein